MDNKQYFAALFIDHSKTFDTVDRTALKLRPLGFLNKLSTGLKTTSQTERISSPHKVIKGVHQRSFLGPLQFILYTINTEQNNANFFYADDTELYCLKHFFQMQLASGTCSTEIL